MGAGKHKVPRIPAPYAIRPQAGMSTLCLGGVLFTAAPTRTPACLREITELMLLTTGPCVSPGRTGLASSCLSLARRGRARGPDAVLPGRRFCARSEHGVFVDAAGAPQKEARGKHQHRRRGEAGCRCRGRACT